MRSRYIYITPPKSSWNNYIYYSALLFHYWKLEYTAVSNIYVRVFFTCFKRIKIFFHIPRLFQLNKISMKLLQMISIRILFRKSLSLDYVWFFRSSVFFTWTRQIDFDSCYFAMMINEIWWRIWNRKLFTRKLLGHAFYTTVYFLQQLNYYLKKHLLLTWDKTHSKLIIFSINSNV